MSPNICNLCGHVRFKPLWVIRHLEIVQCQACGLIYTHSIRTWDYQTSSGQNEGALRDYQRYYWPARKASALKVWDQLESFRNLGRLLDVGCGFGFFLDEARRQSWEVVGVEPSLDQAAWARKNLRLRVLADLGSPELQLGQFDVVTIWDVIEHVTDTRALLRRCRELLRPGGLLLVKTPNADGLLLRGPQWLRPYLLLYRHLVYPANPREHLYHFTPKILAQLFREEGFSVLTMDFSQSCAERPISGGNKLIQAVRYPLMWIAFRLQLPYEMTFIATKAQ
jgi:2-polyprenyl-3-methyl-5-hydroxy-6-metoxy-1,4-benzoquinol methylase